MRTVILAGTTAVLFGAITALSTPSSDLKGRAVELIHSGDEIKMSEGLSMMDEWSRLYNGYWSLQGGDGYQYYGTPKKPAYKTVRWRIGDQYKVASK